MRKFLITVNKQQFEVEVEEVKSGSAAKPETSVKPSGTTVQKSAEPAPVVSHGSNHKAITAPMPGNIFKINVKPGDAVKKGDTIIILEAMKMENELTAHADGKISAVNVKVGEGVSLGQVLIEME
jgi:glutaconyl-CoA/methylmalonyl-CoA decarboxylase subunit gamma